MIIPTSSPIPRAERSTTLAWTDDDDTALVYTESPRLARRWSALGYVPTATVYVQGEPAGWHFAIPTGKISVRRAQTARRPSQQPPRRIPAK